MNTFSEALQSGSILLREGLEALLVIAALAGFLTRAGVPEKVKALYVGAGLAILASFGAAVVFELFFDGEHNDFVEAGVMVIAAVLMLYMSGWMYLKQDPKAWLGDLRRSAERALDSGATVSLGLIAFLAVFREGGETILFLHALAKSSGGWTFGLIAGLVVAAVCLVGYLLRDREARADAAVAAGVPGHLGVPVPDGAALRRRRHPGASGADGGIPIPPRRSRTGSSSSASIRPGRRSVPSS